MGTVEGYRQELNTEYGPAKVGVGWGGRRPRYEAWVHNQDKERINGMGGIGKGTNHEPVVQFSPCPQRRQCK